MSEVWLDQDLEVLEESINNVGNILEVECPTSLWRRFRRLMEEKDSNLSSISQFNKTCVCTGGKKHFSILTPNSSEGLCLAPVIALIQGSDMVQEWIGRDLKKKLFKEAAEPHQCNLDYMMNEFFEGLCFVRFVGVFEERH